MPNKQKLEAEEKVKILLEYLGGEIGQREGARKAGVTHTTFQEWIRIFENYGIDGFHCPLDGVRFRTSCHRV